MERWIDAVTIWGGGICLFCVLLAAIDTYFDTQKDKEYIATSVDGEDFRCTKCFGFHKLGGIECVECGEHNETITAARYYKEEK